MDGHVRTFADQPDPALGETCPVETAMDLLTGKWRMLVLYRLRKGPVRFNALQRSLAPVTQKVLTATLRSLGEDGLIWRDVRAEVPPHVTYGLTPFAEGAAPVFDAMAEWIIRGNRA
ncbi:winged helix-turn-helix transcriptional regulator [Yoonia vestfoldensis]|uniref:winged helix-turn-helix transcriptional regulator n=1 Tax=Yoonia vestfoldensis TaxID=245188 RepID=UPI00035F899F|nr:helix-turn-helix domain-containing protein [Yoonia vestfoldensis]